MGFLLQLATLIMGAAAAANLSESLATGTRRRAQHRELKRGMILPKEAARELERQIRGRVAVGRDLEGHLLIVIRSPTLTLPPTFAGYRVRRQERF